MRRAPGRLAAHERYSVTNFSELGLAAPILKALTDQGYDTPTPIQAKAIPAVMAGSDLLGIAQTGTGKTAAFALPILNRLASEQRAPMPKGCRVLVLSPTRELAAQIADSFRAYGRHMRLSVAVMVGGVPHRPQIHALARGVDVLIATPGRLLDHVAERNILLQGTEVLVLDEADQMLDLGFVKPIRRIVKELTIRRQTLFFSATMPSEIAEMVKDFLRDPVRVTVTPVASTAERVTQRIIHVDNQRKPALLAELFADPALSRALVFTRTKRGADRVTKHLETCGIRVASIHGNKSQRQREVALDAFRRSKIRVLVATDIAARGIDVDDVSHVVNYELPDVPEAYVHRIGRTARAGASGSAISLCAGDERDKLRAIERLTRQSIPFEDRRQDTTLPIEERPARSRANHWNKPRSGGGQGHRGNGQDARSQNGSRQGHDGGQRKWRDRSETRSETKSAAGAGTSRSDRFDGRSRDRTSPAGEKPARTHSDRRDNPRSGAGRDHRGNDQDARSQNGSRQGYDGGQRKWRDRSETRSETGSAAGAAASRSDRWSKPRGDASHGHRGNGQDGRPQNASRQGYGAQRKRHDRADTRTATDGASSADTSPDRRMKHKRRPRYGAGGAKREAG